MITKGLFHTRLILVSLLKRHSSSLCCYCKQDTDLIRLCKNNPLETYEAAYLIEGHVQTSEGVRLWELG